MKIPPKGWALAVLRHLPNEISVRRAAIVRAGFVPRYESLGKRYRYTLLRDPVRDPFLRRPSLRVPELAEEGMLERAQEEAKFAVGTK